MSDEIVKYNYDVVTLTADEIYVYGQLKANESIVISIEDKMKQDIEQMRNRDSIIKNFIINPDIGICLGFNFEGKEIRSDPCGNIIGVYWRTRVFYHSTNKNYWDNFKWGGKY